MVEKMKDVFLLINPNSGKKNIRGLIRIIEKNVPELTFVLSQNKEDADTILRKNINKFSVFILAGGDGTINQALPFFVGKKDKILSVLPMGSGNGFAKEMGFENNLLELLQDILKRETFEIDVLKINEHYSVNVAGVGMEGYIASLFFTQKNRGFWKYVVLTIKALFTFQPFKGKLSLEGFDLPNRYLSISIANNRQFGNNAYIAPKAKPNDGLMDVVMVSPFPFYQYPFFFYKLFQGTLKPSKYLKYKQIQQEFIITTDYSFAHVDGEPFLSNGEFRVSLEPKAITILKTRFCQLSFKI